MIETLLLLSAANAYLIKVLLLEEKESNVGPWPIKNVSIYFETEAHLQPAAFFDRIRRLFGVYDIRKNDFGQLWYVKEGRAEVWRCPVCLGFWTALPFTLIWILSGLPVLWWLPAHLAIISLSNWIYSIWQEKTVTVTKESPTNINNEK